MANRSRVSAEQLHFSDELRNSIKNESPVPSVLMVGARIEGALGLLLEKYLISGSTSEKMLYGQNGTLSTFIARADMCYCLSLIPKDVYEQIVLIGTIRNAFAHSPTPLDFDDTEIAKHWAKLKFPESSMGEWPEIIKKHTAKNPRMRVISIGSAIFGMILSTLIRRTKKVERRWDRAGNQSQFRS